MKTLIKLLTFFLSIYFACYVNAQNFKKLNIVCVGGHPDDPETGCGGTLAKYSAKGHNIYIIYLTTGEAGIDKVSHKNAAIIRKKEAENACKILGAKPIFLGQIDGNTTYTKTWQSVLDKKLLEIKPDIGYTHWSVDSHPDHQIASLLTIQSWLKLFDEKPLYFFEVCANSQTKSFEPTDIVDISDFQEIKKRAVYCHKSQKPNEIYSSSDCNHAEMEKNRGKQIGVKSAEAFIIMK